MWIYQEPSNASTEPLPLPERSAGRIPETPSLVCKELPTSAEALPLEPKNLPEETLTPRKTVWKRHFPASRDCVLLAVAYLMGTFLSGVLQALCDSTERDTLSYYLACWQDLFSASDPAHLPQLFGAEVGTLLGALGVLFALGLSALGPVLIFLFVMLYGAGSGLLFAQLTAGMTPNVCLLFVGAAGIPAAVAAGGLCLFGASALQVSSRIQAFSFGRKGGLPPKAGAGLLAGQCAVAATAFLPLCGAATGLAYLACKVVSQ